MVVLPSQVTPDDSIAIWQNYMVDTGRAGCATPCAATPASTMDLSGNCRTATATDVPPSGELMLQDYSRCPATRADVLCTTMVVVPSHDASVVLL